MFCHLVLAWFGAFPLLWLSLCPEHSHTLRTTLRPCASFGHRGRLTWLGSACARATSRELQRGGEPSTSSWRLPDTRPRYVPFVRFIIIENKLHLCNLRVSLTSYILYFFFFLSLRHTHLRRFPRWTWKPALWRLSGSALWDCSLSLVC